MNLKEDEMFMLFDLVEKFEKIKLVSHIIRNFLWDNY